MTANGKQALGRGLKELLPDEVSLEVKTSRATTAIIEAVEGLPPKMAAVAFANAQNIIKAAKEERGETVEEIAGQLGDLARIRNARRKTKGWFSK